METACSELSRDRRRRFGSGRMGRSGYTEEIVSGDWGRMGDLLSQE